VTADVDVIWSRVQDELRGTVPPDMYDMWLAPLRPVRIDDGPVILVDAPRHLRCWVAERFARSLARAAATALGPQATVEVRGEDTASSTPGAGAGTHPAAAEGAGVDGPGEPMNPKYTFDQFVIGNANRFAHAAALAVAELPGQAYNPLFVYGPPGVGKTHLLHSIGNYVRAYGGGLTVRYVTVEAFTNQFVAAARGGAIERFKGRYRQNDVLLVDDVQFLAAKARTEEEFFHTFDALYGAGAQLVLTCDRMPRDLEAVAERLRERFEAGLVTAIRPPDLATRLTVLRKRVQHDRIAIDDEEVLRVVAERVTTNVRALEGALIRVVAFASLTRRPLSPALAAEVLDDLYPARHPRAGEAGVRGTVPGAAGANAGDPHAPPTIERIQAVCADSFGVTVGDLLSHSRRPHLAWPRQVAMYLAREHTAATLPAIGRSFGGRNHTTVLHACRRAVERLATDPEALEVIRRLNERLAGGGAGAGADRRD
jgi:chromosomal replication initiator protein